MNAEENDKPVPATMQVAEPKAAGWEEVSYTLTRPLPAPGGFQLTTLTFREPNGEQLEQIEDLGMAERAAEGKNPTMKQINALIAILSGQPIEMIRLLHQADIKGASEAVAPLLEGAASSA